MPDYPKMSKTMHNMVKIRVRRWFSISKEESIRYKREEESCVCVVVCILVCVLI
jgi:hypothetical protein